MKRKNNLSIIIPSYNCKNTLPMCIDKLPQIDIIIVDDGSTQKELLKYYKSNKKARIYLNKINKGVSKTRNIGASHSNSDYLMFIDSDCYVLDESMKKIFSVIDKNELVCFGGTYTPIPHDKDFFSKFHSMLVYYSETKKNPPDYIAGHCLIIKREAFNKVGGFPNFGKFPVCEDVLFCTKLKKTGIELKMFPEILIIHHYNYNFLKSVRNTFRKSAVWIQMALKKKQIFDDSGISSVELKLSFFLSVIFLFTLFLSFLNPYFLVPLFGAIIIYLFLMRKFISESLKYYNKTTTILFVTYFFLVYSLSAGAGSFWGLIKNV